MHRLTVAESNIITRFSANNSNLDQSFKPMFHQAGLIPRPKLFQNLPTTCETE